MRGAWYARTVDATARRRHIQHSAQVSKMAEKCREKPTKPRLNGQKGPLRRTKPEADMQKDSRKNLLFSA
jgi:hypothetical protein